MAETSPNIWPESLRTWLPNMLKTPNSEYNRVSIKKCSSFFFNVLPFSYSSHLVSVKHCASWWTLLFVLMMYANINYISPQHMKKRFHEEYLSSFAPCPYVNKISITFTYSHIYTYHIHLQWCCMKICMTWSHKSLS